MCALYCEETARGRRRALKRDEPLDRRQQACCGGIWGGEVRALYSLRGRERKARHVPHIPQSVRASPMILASFASFGASALVDSARTPARCCRRALACKIGINTLAPYWMSCDIQSAFEDMYGKETRGGRTFTMNSLLQVRTTKVSRSLWRERWKRGKKRTRYRSMC